MQGGVAKTARIGGCYKNCRTCLQSEERLLYCALFGDGGIAQLGERLHGMQEVIGSIPFTSTNFGQSEFFRLFQGFDPIV